MLCPHTSLTSKAQSILGSDYKSFSSGGSYTSSTSFPSTIKVFFSQFGFTVFYSKLPTHFLLVVIHEIMNLSPLLPPSNASKIPAADPRRLVQPKTAASVAGAHWPKNVPEWQMHTFISKFRPGQVVLHQKSGKHLEGEGCVLRVFHTSPMPLLLWDHKYSGTNTHTKNGNRPKIPTQLTKLGIPTPEQGPILGRIFPYAMSLVCIQLSYSFLSIPMSSFISFVSPWSIFASLFFFFESQMLN